MQTKKIITRKITTWNTKIFCFARFKYGSSLLPPLGSFLLTQIPAIILTVDLCLRYQYVLMTFLLLLQIFVNTAMLAVLCTDPGILPQIVYRYETEEQMFAIPSKAYEDQHKYIITNNSLLCQQKYCPECNIYRPIRSIHCGTCNHCVQIYDHHCPWLAICIGKYNYKYYMLYLLSLIVTILYSLGISLYFLIVSIQGEKDPSEYALIIVVTVVLAFFSIPLIRLFFYHIYLIKKGITTNEDLKNTYRLIDDNIPFAKQLCSSQQEGRYPIISEYHYQRGRNYEKQIQLEDTTTSNREKPSVLNSLIQNEHL